MNQFTPKLGQILALDSWGFNLFSYWRRQSHKHDGLTDELRGFYVKCLLSPSLFAYRTTILSWWHLEEEETGDTSKALRRMLKNRLKDYINIYIKYVIITRKELIKWYFSLSVQEWTLVKQSGLPLNIWLFMYLVEMCNDIFFPQCFTAKYISLTLKFSVLLVICFSSFFPE